MSITNGGVARQIERPIPLAIAIAARGKGVVSVKEVINFMASGAIAIHMAAAEARVAGEASFPACRAAAILRRCNSPMDLATREASPAIAGTTAGVAPEVFIHARAEEENVAPRPDAVGGISIFPSLIRVSPLAKVPLSFGAREAAKARRRLIYVVRPTSA